jgi:crotonobetainyl-CoA:carnitine CoA-transferase CaiB-like acyl-CoA transferase
VHRGLDRQPQGTSPLYSLYECKDKQWLQLGCLHAGFVEKAVEVLEIGPQVEPLRSLSGFGDGVVPRSEAVRRPFREAVGSALSLETREFWLQKLALGDVPVAPVLHSEDYLCHPQAKANGLIIVGDEQGEDVLQPAPFVRLKRSAVFEPKGASSLVQQEREVVLDRPGDSGTDLSRPGPGEVGKGARPLSGITVVEMANVIAGPMAGRCLADLGARVIKLEPLDGDIFRQQGAPEFHPLNAGKLSVAINLKTPEGAVLARKLLSHADVFLNNLRPGAVDRLGLGYDELHALNRGLVWCQISAFGASGPLAKMPGGDPLAGALTGMQSTQGGRGRPVYVYGAPIDYTSGFLAAAGMAFALYRREATGLGALVDTSLLDAGALLNADAMADYAARGERDNLPVSQYRRQALKGLYPTATGWIAVSATDAEADKLWSAMRPYLEHQLCHGLDDDVVADELWRAFTKRSADEWLALLLGAGVPCAPVRLKRDIRLAGPLVAGNGWVSGYDTPVGLVSFVDKWLSLTGFACGSQGPAPALGQHSQAVLETLGVTLESFKRLVEAGIVAGEEK